MQFNQCIKQFEATYLSVYSAPIPDWIKYLAVEMCSAHFTIPEIMEEIEQLRFRLDFNKIKNELRIRGVTISGDIVSMITELLGNGLGIQEIVKKISSHYPENIPKQSNPNSYTP